MRPSLIANTELIILPTRCRQISGIPVRVCLRRARLMVLGKEERFLLAIYTDKRMRERASERERERLKKKHAPTGFSGSTKIFSISLFALSCTDR